MTETGPAPSSENADDDPVTGALARLDQAAGAVQRRIEDLTARLARAEADAMAARDSDADRARLAQALDEARASEAALAEAAEEAGAALDAAMDDLRAVLAESGEGA
ncbi:MAG: DUF4164 family protein [Oceanicaulis sp.]